MTETETIIIRNEVNNVLTRWPCCLCGGHTEKQSYLFKIEIDGKVGRIVCDECAEFPEDIPERARHQATHLRVRAEALEAIASYKYVTEVVPVQEEDRDQYRDQYGMREEDNWPNWMRTRVGLPEI